MVNDAKAEYKASFEVRGIAKDSRLYRYSVNETDRDRDELKIDPQAEYRLPRTASTFTDRLAPMSVTVYSTYKLTHSDDGVMAE